MQKKLLVIIQACLFLLISSIAFAATTESTASSSPGAQANASASSDKKGNYVIPVIVEFSGNDSYGQQLAMSLKDSFNVSSLFAVTIDQKKPKIRIILTSVTEFADRPYAGSAYAVTWAYFAKPDVFSSYLDMTVGVVTKDNIDSVVTGILEKTSSIIDDYPYLLE